MISPNIRNELASDVIVVPCSTRLLTAPTHVRLARGDGGLPQASVLKCEQITTLPKRLLSPSALGGPLSEALLEDVERGVLRAMGVPIP